MGIFFIDTSSGSVATQAQLVEAGVADPGTVPPRPWHQLRGDRDATTLWYSVLRKRERGIFIGTLVLRHSSHHASLLERGWEEIPWDAIGLPADASR